MDPPHSPRVPIQRNFPCCSTRAPASKTLSCHFFLLPSSNPTTTNNLQPASGKSIFLFAPRRAAGSCMMTTQYRKLESLTFGHETRNCNVSLIDCRCRRRVAIRSIAPSEKLTAKQDSSSPRAPVAGRRLGDGLRQGIPAGSRLLRGWRLRHWAAPRRRRSTLTSAAEVSARRFAFLSCLHDDLNLLRQVGITD